MLGGSIGRTVVRGHAAAPGPGQIRRQLSARAFNLPHSRCCRGPRHSVARELAVVLPVTSGSQGSNAQPAQPRHTSRRRGVLPASLRASCRVRSNVPLRVCPRAQTYAASSGSVHLLTTGPESVIGPRKSIPPFALGFWQKLAVSVRINRFGDSYHALLGHRDLPVRSELARLQVESAGPPTSIPAHQSAG